jgi:hypothetical protein
MADRDGSGRWQKGCKSPNAGGRPREVADIRELAKQHSPRAIAVLAEIMDSKDSPPAARTAAATALLDRAFGRPPASIEGRVEVQHSIADTAAQVLQELTQRAKDRRAEAARVIDAVAVPTTRQ